jgi:hypothetical protein
MEGQFSFFTLGAVEPTALKDLKIGENGEPIRKRQQHRKSRNGCANCKRRKVKVSNRQIHFVDWQGEEDGNEY